MNDFEFNPPPIRPKKEPFGIQSILAASSVGRGGAAAAAAKLLLVMLAAASGCCLCSPRCIGRGSVNAGISLGLDRLEA